MKNEKRGRWMVVDNDADALEAISSLAAAVTGAEIFSFQSPWEAVNAFAAAPESFQFVVTDFEMPRMTGVELRRHLHALSPSLKILLITGGGRFTEETAALSGFCGLLRKPFSLTALRLAFHFAEKQGVNRTESFAAN